MGRLDAPQDGIADEDVLVTGGDDVEGGARRVSVGVAPGDAGGRLDKLLGSAADIGLSRSRVKRLILEGRVAVNGKAVTDPSHTVDGGAEITVDIPDATPAEPLPQALPLEVVYEDRALIVIDKPAGLVVHPGAGVPDGTLVNALLHHCGASLSGIGGVRRPGIVHRLDKETSGLLVVAKTDAAHHALSEQFADHGRTGPLDRGYKALVWGAPQQPSGRIETLIGRSPTNRLQMAVLRSGGRTAITHYRVLQRYGPKPDFTASLIECKLETGRTHQIRVHMTHAGYPLIADPDYGRGFKSKMKALAGPARECAERLGRQALHAYLLAFAHPDDGRVLRFETPLPDDMQALQAALQDLE